MESYTELQLVVGYSMIAIGYLIGVIGCVFAFKLSKRQSKSKENEEIRNSIKYSSGTTFCFVKEFEREI